MHRSFNIVNGAFVVMDIYKATLNRVSTYMECVLLSISILCDFVYKQININKIMFIL